MTMATRLGERMIVVCDENHEMRQDEFPHADVPATPSEGRMAGPPRRADGDSTAIVQSVTRLVYPNPEKPPSRRLPSACRNYPANWAHVSLDLPGTPKVSPRRPAAAPTATRPAPVPRNGFSSAAAVPIPRPVRLT